MSWKLTETGDVQITLSRDDYQNLLVLIGKTLAYAQSAGQPSVFHEALALANTISAGNPSWRRYRTEAEIAESERVPVPDEGEKREED